MRILNPHLDTTVFFDALGKAPQRVLMLDYDGTLAPFHIERHKAIPYPGVREALAMLVEDARTRIVLVSGRWTKDLIPLLDIDEIPELWGSHGWERRMSDGTYEHALLSASFIDGLAVARSDIDKVGLAELVEEKPASLAVHWRGLSEDRIHQIQNTVLDQWTPLAEQTGLTIHNFDGGLELRTPGKTKGSVVETILSEVEPHTMVAYMGDDLTDEDAFTALSGRGLSVLVRPEIRPSTSADLWLQPPVELLAFFSQWHDACSGHSSLING